MTRDDIANTFKAAFDALHAEISLEPDGPRKARAEVLADVAHRALDRLRKIAADDGLIQPMSGGDPEKPDGP